MTWVQWAAIAVIGLVLSAPILGDLLHNWRVNRQFRGHLESERRRVRLEKLADLADEHDAATTDEERQRVFIKASALGFLDDREAFHLDAPRQPDTAA